MHFAAYLGAGAALALRLAPPGNPGKTKRERGRRSFTRELLEGVRV